MRTAGQRRARPSASKSASPGLLQVGEDLGRGALAGLDRALQIALEVLRGVLPAEVAVVAPLLLGPGEAGVLPGLPVGVRALRPRVPRPPVADDPAVPLRVRTGQDQL